MAVLQDRRVKAEDSKDHFMGIKAILGQAKDPNLAARAVLGQPVGIKEVENLNLGLGKGPRISVHLQE